MKFLKIKYCDLVVGLMLKEGIDVYVLLVDDDAIDAVIKETGRGFMA